MLIKILRAVNKKLVVKVRANSPSDKLLASLKVTDGLLMQVAAVQ